jgi:hypothetical protein
MAYGYPGMYYPSPSVEQIAQQFQNAMGQYQNFQQGQMQQPKQKRCGEYIIVDGFDEVEKTPVRMDGTPTLFICPKEHIAWAKQYSRNGPTCETFPYSSSLTAISHGPEQPEVDYTKLLDDTPEQKQPEDIDAKIEAAVERVFKKIMQKQEDKAE